MILVMPAHVDDKDRDPFAGFLSPVSVVNETEHPQESNATTNLDEPTHPRDHTALLAYVDHDHGDPSHAAMAKLDGSQLMAQTLGRGQESTLNPRPKDSASGGQFGPLTNADMQGARAAAATPSDPVVERARAALHQLGDPPDSWSIITDNDQTRAARRDVIRSVLDAAASSDKEATADELIAALYPYTFDPTVTAGIARVRALREERRARLEQQRNAWKTQEWVTNGPARTQGHIDEATAPNEHIDRKQIHDSISKVAPNLPESFKLMLVGQAYAEQGSSKSFAYNYMGMEGGASTGAWVNAKTSGTKTPAEVRADRSKYSDWTGGELEGRDASSVDAQLAAGYDKIGVMYHGPRPGYRSMDEASAHFVHAIEGRIHTLMNSTDPAHVKLAQDALNGDAAAYAKIVASDFTVKDASNKTTKIGAYNPDKPNPKTGKGGFAQRIEDQIGEARADPALKPKEFSSE